MRIFDFRCSTHGLFEVWTDDKEFSPQNGTVICGAIDNGTKCGVKCEWEIKRFPAIDPDPLWAGKMTDLGYVSSRTEYENKMKSKGLIYAESGDDTDIKMIHEKQDRIIRKEIHDSTVESVVGRPYEII